MTSPAISSTSSLPFYNVKEISWRLANTGNVLVFYFTLVHLYQCITLLNNNQICPLESNHKINILKSYLIALKCWLNTGVSTLFFSTNLHGKRMHGAFNRDLVCLRLVSFACVIKTFEKAKTLIYSCLIYFKNG